MAFDTLMKQIEEAEMILVGLGEDFDDNKRLADCEKYNNGKMLLQESGYQWLLPAWKEYCSKKMEDIITPALHTLSSLLDTKNYYVVSTATDYRIRSVEWKKDRCVMPCGNTSRKQCVNGCAGILLPVTPEDKYSMENIFDSLYNGVFPENGISTLGNCPECDKGMVLNTIYTENYNESGYTSKWEEYMKWLQGTLNRKLVVLELGVGLKYPSVIRWPAEKIAFFNNKASFYRINEKLYQLTPELSNKGYSIAKNAIEWLHEL